MGSLFTSLFGTTETQGVNLPAELQQQLGAASQGLVQQTGQFAPQAQQTAGQVQTGFGQFAPQLATSFQAPQFGAELDPTSRALISQEMQRGTQIAQRAAQETQRQFRQRPGVGEALARQTFNRNILQQNPLTFAAAQDQRQREMQQARVSQQAQELSNRALLVQGQEQARLQQLGNQALNQQLGIAGSGVQAQQNLLASLGSLGSILGTQVQRRQGLIG